jgi:hypothetical protein
VQPTYYNYPSSLLILEYPGHTMITSHSISVDTNERTVDLDLRGIVYHRGYHFTTRIISNEGTIWYHAGSVTGTTCIKVGYISETSDATLKKCENRKLVLAVYAQIQTLMIK